MPSTYDPPPIATYGAADPHSRRRTAPPAGRASGGQPSLDGASDPIRRLCVLISRVAPTASTVLVTGESGTGKEVVARLIHARSPRSDAPFVALNCGAVPEGLIEAELFGHERGAFTGAYHARSGCFERASNGTLFLDEVTECAPALQVKLLRALQERECHRLGGSRRIHIDVRVIAATNRPLEQAIRDGSFRPDLYYRLRVVELCLPPLRERPGDIPILCSRFLRRYAERNSSGLREVSAPALAAMLRYPWPGNVRELENVIERATVLASPEDGEQLLPAHLPPEMLDSSPSAGELATPEDRELNLEVATRRLRRAYVEEAMRRAAGNKSEAARLLGISRRGLYNLMQSDGACAGAHPA